MRRRSPDIADDVGRRFDEAFDRTFGIVAFQLNRHLVDHMLRAARELRVDFESLVLWGVLSHQNVAHLLPPGSHPAAVLDETGRVPSDSLALRPLRIRDLAQITGIPRETVRRKLLALQAMGRVQRLRTGWAIDPDSVGPELREFTRESARRLRAAARDIDDSLAAGLLATDGEAQPHAHAAAHGERAGARNPHDRTTK
jgi:hypothetical protein